MTAEQGSPTTEAGRALNANLAYDSYPEDYLSGDYISRYRDAILAIEAEAYEQGRKAGLTEALKKVTEATTTGDVFESCGGYGCIELRREDWDVVIDTLTRLRDTR